MATNTQSGFKYEGLSVHYPAFVRDKDREEIDPNTSATMFMGWYRSLPYTLTSTQKK